MKSCMRIALYLFALLFVAGCASTDITSRDQDVTGEIPRPSKIRTA